MSNIIKERLSESIDVKKRILEDNELLDNIENLAEEIVKCIKNNHKLIICGNGGSASDALHFAGEIVGRFQKERNAWPAVVLNADVATMTAIANDYGYDEVFSRQLEAHVNDGDIFIGISTSGNSQNICNAMKIANDKKIITAGLLGKDGGKLAGLVDYPIIVPSDVTARIQESHITLIHIICEIVEERI